MIMDIRLQLIKASDHSSFCERVTEIIQILLKVVLSKIELIFFLFPNYARQL